MDLVGIEPTTSSMPFLIFDCSRATATERERQQRGSVHASPTHVRCPYLYPSKSTRLRPIWAGIGGLRHKP